LRIDPHAVLLCPEALLDDPGRIAGDCATCGNITRDHRAGSNDGTVADPYARVNYGAFADIAVLANPGVDAAPQSGIVRQDVGARRHSRMFADVDASGIGLVEFGSAEDSAARADVHAPQISKGGSSGVSQRGSKARAKSEHYEPTLTHLGPLSPDNDPHIFQA
jgi:hypothetical protein